MITSHTQNKRVVIVYWKNNIDNPFQVYSSLKNFCQSYIEYNYNTLSNYLSKRKIAFENDKVRIERTIVISKPPLENIVPVRNIVPEVRKVSLKEADDAANDLDYWLSKPPSERVAAVTYIISQSLHQGERMDKQKILKRKIRA
jgi:hypothetical protein